jgi:hypothetical protein
VVNHTKKNFLKILKQPKCISLTKLAFPEEKSKYFLVLTSFARLCTKYGSKLKEKFTTVVGKTGPLGKHAQWK